MIIHYEKFNYNVLPNYNKENINRHKKNDEKIIKKIIQKITESTSAVVGSVAATATIAVVSVVMFVNIIVNKPTIELINLIDKRESINSNEISTFKFNNSMIRFGTINYKKWKGCVL